MGYLVIVTFDIENGESKDYECIDKKFNNIGLGRTLRGENGADTELPFNTYAGEFTGANTGTVRDSVLNQAQVAIRSCSVKGKLFIAVGNDWAWGTRRI